MEELRYRLLTYSNSVTHHPCLRRKWERERARFRPSPGNANGPAVYTKAGSRLEVGGAQRGADEGQLSYRFMVKATLRSVFRVVAVINI